MIHDIRVFINYSRGKYSRDSLERFIKINLDIFTEQLDKSKF